MFAVLDVLLEHGADPNITAYNHISPLALAVQRGHQDCVEVRKAYML